MSSVNSVNNGNSSVPSIMKVSSGSAGLIASLIYQMMAMYGKIVGYDCAQKQSMIQEQSDQATNQANATIDSGNDYGNSLIEAGAIGIGAEFGGIMVSAGSDYVNGKGAALDKANEFNAQRSNLTSLGTASRETPVDLGTSGTVASERTAIDARKGEFVDGNFSKVEVNAKGEVDATSKKAIAELKGDTSETGKATFAKFKKDIETQRDINAKEENSAWSRVSDIGQKGTNYQQRIVQLGSSGSSIAQGLGNKSKGQDDATAALASTASNMAGSSANDLGSAMAKAADAMVNEIQVLERVQQVSSGR